MEVLAMVAHLPLPILWRPQMIPDIPDSIPFVIMIATILLAPIYYGRTTTTKEDSK